MNSENKNIIEELEQFNKPVFENEFMVVEKVIQDIPTHNKKWVKRVQLVRWKSKKADTIEFDIRRYNVKDEVYGRGMSLTQREFREFKKAIGSIDF
jgi:hypothetical protein